MSSRNRFRPPFPLLVVTPLVLAFPGTTPWGHAAADSWYAPAPPAVHDLNGVDWGGPPGSERFVAVGDNGAILSSADLGRTWTNHTSDTSSALRAVVVSSHPTTRAVAVGDNGTILTSADFVTWTARQSGTTQTLRAIDRGGNLWLAVGDGGIVCRSTNGVDWSTTTYAVSTDLRAVAFASFSSSFVVGGTGGVLATTANGVNFTPIGSQSSLDYIDIAIYPDRSGFIATGQPTSSIPGTIRTRALAIGGAEVVTVGTSGFLTHRPSTLPGGSPVVSQSISLPGSPSLHAIDVDPTVTFVAVGAGGRIWTTNPQAAQFPVVEQPGVHDTVTAISGSTALIPTGATSTAPLQFRWRRDGSFSTVGTAESLALPGVRYSDSGAYTCTVTNSSAQVLIQRALTVLPAPASLVGVASLAADPLPPTPGTAGPLLLPDGSRLEFQLADNFLTLRRVLADNSIDPTFLSSPVALTNPHGAEFSYNSANARLDDSGRILVAASGSQTFPRYHGADLIRFTADGAIDLTFERRWHSGGPIVIISTAGGKILCEFHSISPSTLAPGTSVSLLRLDDSGAQDPNWPGLSYSSSLSNDFQLPSVIEDGIGGFFILRSRRTNEALPRLINTGFLDPHWVEHYDSQLRLVRDLSVVLEVDFSGLATGTNRVITLARTTSGQFRLAGNFRAINQVTTNGLALVTADTQPATTRLANLSVRTRAGAADESLIIGVVFAGNGTRPILARGIGPGLDALGVSGHLENPALRLHKGSTVIAFNSDWSEAPDPAAIAGAGQRLGAFPLASSSTDAAILAALDAGTFTAQVDAGGSTPGIALAEIYDDDTAPAGFTELRVSNFSARAPVASGEGTFIAGFAVAGSNTIRLLLRGIGPGLGAFGVAQPATDPRLTLYAGSEVIATNDDWGGNAEIVAAAEQVGAFALGNAREAAMVVTLAPGAYTLHLQGASGDAGIALVEVYELP